MNDEMSALARARTILYTTAQGLSSLTDGPTLDHHAVLLLSNAHSAMDMVLRYAREESEDVSVMSDRLMEDLRLTVKLIESGHRTGIPVDRAELLRSVVALGNTAQVIAYRFRMHLPTVSERLIGVQQETFHGTTSAVGSALRGLLEDTPVSSGFLAGRR